MVWCLTGRRIQLCGDTYLHPAINWRFTFTLNFTRTTSFYDEPLLTKWTKLVYIWLYLIDTNQNLALTLNSKYHLNALNSFREEPCHCWSQGQLRKEEGNWGNAIIPSNLPPPPTTVLVSSWPETSWKAKFYDFKSYYEAVSGRLT
jgi:hypothetical protein